MSLYASPIVFALFLWLALMKLFDSLSIAGLLTGRGAVLFVIGSSISKLKFFATPFAESFACLPFLDREMLVTRSNFRTPNDSDCPAGVRAIFLVGELGLVGLSADCAGMCVCHACSIYDWTC